MRSRYVAYHGLHRYKHRARTNEISTISTKQTAHSHLSPPMPYTAPLIPIYNPNLSITYLTWVNSISIIGQKLQHHSADLRLTSQNSKQSAVRHCV